MDIRRLRYFVTVAEELHFGKAAERLGMAQQPLSVQIKALETELGCALFERAANRIRLTAAGDVFLGGARTILDQAAAAIELTRRAARGEDGMLRLGHCSAAMQHVVPEAIRVLKRLYPMLGIALKELGWSAQVELLVQGQIDVGFMYRPPGDHSSLAMLDLHEDGFVVGLPATHPLAALKRVELSALAGEPYVAISPKFNACALRVAHLLRQGEVARPIAYEVDDKVSALGLVGNGLGFTVLPELAALPFPNVEYRQLDTPVRVRLAAVWSRQRAPSLIRDRLIETLRSLAISEAGASPS